MGVGEPLLEQELGTEETVSQARQPGEGQTQVHRCAGEMAQLSW